MTLSLSNLAERTRFRRQFWAALAAEEDPLLLLVFLILAEWLPLPKLGGVSGEDLDFLILDEGRSSSPLNVGRGGMFSLLSSFPILGARRGGSGLETAPEDLLSWPKSKDPPGARLSRRFEVTPEKSRKVKKNRLKNGLLFLGSWLLVLRYYRPWMFS